MSAPRDRRPVIGFLVNTLFDGYEEAIWQGVTRTAEELDVDLLALLGGALADPGEAFSVFNLLRPENVDGVLVLSPAIGFLCGPAGVAKYLERFAPIPVVSISERLPGCSSIVVDNQRGMTAVVNHLATVHGKRRIGFIRGALTSTDAVQRDQAYRDELARLGLPFDPSLVVDGDHWPVSGVRAVRVLLDDRRVSLDALVASNDHMAIAAMQELQRRGLSVPGDVAVAGFDDIVDAASTNPPLTTARQPLYEMGREAVQRVLAMIRGEHVEPEVRSPPALHVRQSCGCSGLEGGARPVAVSPAERPTPASLAAALGTSFPDLDARLGIPSWSLELASALLSGAGRERDLRFLHALERLLARGLDCLPEPGPWLHVLRELMAGARRGAGGDDAGGLAALSDAADALVASMASQAELARRMRTDMETRVLHRMSQPFPLPEDVFIPNLLAALEALSVRSFFLSRYLGPDLREASLLVHADPAATAELETPPTPFPSHRLIPGRFSPRRRRSHAVLPIQSPDGPIGFALCEIGSLNSSGYEMLMHEIDAVLSVNALLAEVQDQHRQLLDTARQAGMAEVAVGALHNVGNLLSSVSVSADQIAAAAATAAGSDLRRAATLLGARAPEIAQAFSRDPQLAALPVYLDEAVGALWEELARIQAESRELQEKTGLIRESIRALQDHARGRSEHAVRETVELSVLVRSALEIQRAQLARWGVQVRQELGGLPPLLTQRSKLVHVFVNLIKNAVEAMRTTPEGQRLLVLRGERQADGRIRLEVKDSGEGIAPVDLARVFTYGFTTKRDGHGFGLYTCARYVKQLGGSMDVASEGAGRGATFRLLLDPAGGGENGAPPVQAAPD